MVVKEIVSRLLEEEEKLEWWFEQDIDKEEERFEGDEDGGEMVVKEIVSRLLEEGEVSHFGVDGLRFHTCLTDILGFLEKLEWWFEQDIDKEEERFEGDEDCGEI
ncbi:hypothetical protein Tco_1423465 [Tanacetum coccineum]